MKSPPSAAGFNTAGLQTPGSTLQDGTVSMIYVSTIPFPQHLPVHDAPLSKKRSWTQKGQEYDSLAATATRPAARSDAGPKRQGYD